jgi:SAM-dependent methyltransferase
MGLRHAERRVNEVLEHVPDDRQALKEVHRILKPSGILFVFSPNRLFPFESHCVRLRRSDRRVPLWVPFIPYIPLRFGVFFFIMGRETIGKKNWLTWQKPADFRSSKSRLSGPPLKASLAVSLD